MEKLPMLSIVKTFFDNHLEPKEADGEQILKASELAGAALMVELIQTDSYLDARESEAFLMVLKDTFDLSDEEMNEIKQLAEAQARDATSLYEFTRLINDGFNYSQKVKLIDNLWRIAFADEKLDKYEESLIRQIADLIYVSHADFIQSKMQHK